MRKWAFVRDYANWFDTLMVLLSVFDIYLTLASVRSDGARQSASWMHKLLMSGLRVGDLGFQ